MSKLALNKETIMKNLKRHCDIFALVNSGYTGRAKVTGKRYVTVYTFWHGHMTVKERERRRCHA